MEEVLAETGVVRRELGWPVMATPLSQLVGTQAVLNIVTGERYSMVSDELVNYALGRYGEPPAPIEPNVRDRILASARAAAIAATAPEEPTLAELRGRYGTDDDDLLILRALIPEGDIAAMQASGPPRRDYSLGPPQLDEIRTLMAIARAPYVHIANARFELELRR